MQLSYYDFLHYTGLSPNDPCAISEYEIMHRIGLMLPSRTSPSVLRRLWRDAFLNADPIERRMTYRIRKGAFI